MTEQDGPNIHNEIAPEAYDVDKSQLKRDSFFDGEPSARYSFTLFFFLATRDPKIGRQNCLLACFGKQG